MAMIQTAHKQGAGRLMQYETVNRKEEESRLIG